MWTMAGCRLMLELALAVGDEYEIDEWWILMLGHLELEAEGPLN